jgi:hypothetical protein
MSKWYFVNVDRGNIANGDRVNIGIAKQKRPSTVSKET